MELPPSMLCQDDYPLGPWGMARYIEDRMAELEEAKAECRTRAEKRPINKRLHMLKDILKWCEARAGYVNPMKDAANG